MKQVLLTQNKENGLWNVRIIENTSERKPWEQKETWNVWFKEDQFKLTLCEAAKIASKENLPIIMYPDYKRH